MGTQRRLTHRRALGAAGPTVSAVAASLVLPQMQKKTAEFRTFMS